MKNIFLTGGIGVGKSTVINRFTDVLDYLPYGFQTLPAGSGKSGRNDLLIRPFCGSQTFDENPMPGRGGVAIAAVRSKRKRVMEISIEAFDTIGAEILRISRTQKNPRLIIMDELGFMESEAYIFQREVFLCLDSKTPVLGVLKAASTPFLDMIRERGDVSIIEVTPENRERILAELPGLIENVGDRTVC